MTLEVISTGSNPVRDLVISAGTLDDNGYSRRGGPLGSRAALNRGESLSVVGYESGEHLFGSKPRNDEFRFEIRPGGGFYVNLQWRSPLFPWRRPSHTYAWPPIRRFASEVPEKLKGRNEISFLKRTRDPGLDSTSPSFVALQEADNRAIVTTDETFDSLVTCHRGPVMVGLGPTWQGKWWDDVKRVLDSFAARHAPRVRVLVVNVDECPVLAERYAADSLPVFKVLLRGEVTASHDGALALPELEREFAEYLQ